MKATTMDLLDLMKDFGLAVRVTWHLDTDNEQTCEETNISIVLVGLIHKR